MLLQQAFDIHYEYPTYFLRGIFQIHNNCLHSIITQKEPDRHHNVCVVIEEGVVAARQDILAEIITYCDKYKSTINLVAPPLVYGGGEQVKAFETLELFCRDFEKMNLCRQSFIIVVGGGAFLDAVCFAASIFHRGIRHIRVPTTVLAQADSGVGVKNAVNMIQKKNLIGCFFPPYAVINDFSMLDTLPDRDWIAGITEAFKVALIKDKVFFHWLCDNCAAVRNRDCEKMEYLVTHCARLHLEHIRTSGDPFELGSARPLDFGHWLAHRLEMHTAGELRHGEAVAIGLAVDSYYAAEVGFLDNGSFERLLIALADSGFCLWHDCLKEYLLKLELIENALDEFREHLGGELHITFPKPLGDRIEVNSLDTGIIRDAIQYLKDMNNED